jgi:arylformamidase
MRSGAFTRFAMTCFVPRPATFPPEALVSEVTRDIPYAEPALERQILDVYAPKDAKNLPVVFWIHGGGWQTGDKSSVREKPRLFMERGYVFVSTNYRLLPTVEMKAIFRDVAQSLGWVYQHIAEYGGDPNRLFVMGHSAGAQLAALMCCDERYLREAGVPATALKGCVPIDGDTYDLRAIIETAETRLRAHGEPPPTYGHRIKFGNDSERFRDYSVVTHIARGKGIPPFLILYVADHPDTAAQARRLRSVLKDAGIPVTMFGARDTTHMKLNDNLGTTDDLATKEIDAFLASLHLR